MECLSPLLIPTTAPQQQSLVLGQQHTPQCQYSRSETLQDTNRAQSTHTWGCHVRLVMMISMVLPLDEADSVAGLINPDA